MIICWEKVVISCEQGNSEQEIQTNMYFEFFGFFLSNANYLTLDTNLASYECASSLFYGLGSLLLGVKTDSRICT